MKFVKLKESENGYTHVVNVDHIIKFMEVDSPGVTTVFFTRGNVVNYDVSVNELIDLISR